MSNLLSESAIPIRLAHRHYPQRTHISTPVRHALTGVKIGDSIVKLESCRAGGRRITSIEAIARFFAACSMNPTNVPVGNVGAPTSDDEAIKRELSDAGL